MSRRVSRPPASETAVGHGAAGLAVVEVPPARPRQPAQGALQAGGVPDVVRRRHPPLRQQVPGAGREPPDDGLQGGDRPTQGLAEGEAVGHQVEGGLHDPRPREPAPALPQAAHAGHLARDRHRQRSVDVGVAGHRAVVLVLVGPLRAGLRGTHVVHAVVGGGRGPGVGVERPHPAAGALQDHGGHQVAADPVLVGMAHGAGQAGRGRRVEGVAALAEDPLAGPGDQLRLGRHDAAGPDHGVRGPVGHHAISGSVAALMLAGPRTRNGSGQHGRRADPGSTTPVRKGQKNRICLAPGQSRGAADREPGIEDRPLRTPAQAPPPPGAANSSARRLPPTLPMSHSLPAETSAKARASR